MLNRGKFFESAHRFPTGKWHRFMSWLERDERSNRYPSLTHHDLSFTGHSSDPFASFKVQIANGDFFHVHNVHKTGHDVN